MSCSLPVLLHEYGLLNVQLFKLLAITTALHKVGRYRGKQVVRGGAQLGFQPVLDNGSRFHSRQHWCRRRGTKVFCLGLPDGHDQIEALVIATATFRPQRRRRDGTLCHGLSRIDALAAFGHQCAGNGRQEGVGRTGVAPGPAGPAEHGLGCRGGGRRCRAGRFEMGRRRERKG